MVRASHLPCSRCAAAPPSVSSLQDTNAPYPTAAWCARPPLRPQPSASCAPALLAGASPSALPPLHTPETGNPEARGPAPTPPCPHPPAAAAACPAAAWRRPAARWPPPPAPPSPARRGSSAPTGRGWRPTERQPPSGSRPAPRTCGTGSQQHVQFSRLFKRRLVTVAADSLARAAARFAMGDVRARKRTAVRAGVCAGGGGWGRGDGGFCEGSGRVARQAGALTRACVVPVAPGCPGTPRG